MYFIIKHSTPIRAPPSWVVHDYFYNFPGTVTSNYPVTDCHYTQSFVWDREKKKIRLRKDAGPSTADFERAAPDTEYENGRICYYQYKLVPGLAERGTMQVVTVEKRLLYYKGKWRTGFALIRRCQNLPIDQQHDERKTVVHEMADWTIDIVLEGDEPNTTLSINTFDQTGMSWGGNAGFYAFKHLGFYDAILTQLCRLDRDSQARARANWLSAGGDVPDEIDL